MSEEEEAGQEELNTWLTTGVDMHYVNALRLFKGMCLGD
jgi:hypothetical protein